MTTTPAPSVDSENLLDLVHRCSELCTAAERSMRKSSPERESFLAENLEAALLQLELILRLLGEQGAGSRDSERQSLLRRLFARSGTKEVAASTVEAPSFDVSTQGLQGNSWTVSIAEILGFLAFANKTGLLWVDSPTGNFIVGIVKGRLMHASSDRTPEGLRLGEVLVGLGFLTRRQLERYLASNAEGDAVSGEKLLEAGMISDEELREALSYQVTKLFNRLIHTDQAVFRFQEGVKVQLAYQVDIDINQLLLDSARKRDESVSPAQQVAAVLQEWNTWRSELGSKLAAQAAAEQETPEAAPKDAADANPPVGV
ncbi:MAG: DUF4388 domain-containing protein [Planctomycetota bacterium]